VVLVVGTSLVLHGSLSVRSAVVILTLTQEVRQALSHMVVFLLMHRNLE
jgi:hypothetical protein